MIFPAFFSLSLNLAIRSSWSEWQSVPDLVFADYIELLQLWLQRNQRSNCQHLLDHHKIIIKWREFQRNIYFCFIDYAKAFDCVDHNKLWNVLQEMGIPDHLTWPPDLPPEKSVCRSRSNNNWTWNNRRVPNRKRSTSRLYIVTLLI